MTEKQIVKYDITEAAVAEMESRFMGLAITNIEDKEQFQVVHDARMVVKNHRVAVEKKRKELKADALAWGKKVDTEAKRIFGMLEPIESHLMAEENKVIEAEKRIKEEEDRIEREIIQGRVNSLQMYGAVLPYQEVAVMSDEEFETVLEGSKLAFAAEQKRLADEEAARKAEDERLAAERAELEKQRKEQEEKDAARKAELDAIQEKIEADIAALEAEKKAEQDRKDREEFERQAKIKAEQDAIEAAYDAETERLVKIEADKAEAARQEALKPDREKLMAFAQFLQEGIAYPEMTSDETDAILRNAIKQVYDIGEEIIQEVEKL